MAKKKSADKYFVRKLKLETSQTPCHDCYGEPNVKTVHHETLVCYVLGVGCDGGGWGERETIEEEVAG